MENYHLLRSTSQVAEILPRIMSKDIWAVDTETTGLDPHVDKVTLFQVGNEFEQFLVDCRSASLEPLRVWLEDRRFRKVIHNGKFDYKMIKGTFGIEVEGIRDTMLGAKLMTNGLQDWGFGLDDLMEKYLCIELDKTLQKSFINHKGEFTESQLLYAAKDVSNLIPLWNIISQRLTEQGQTGTAMTEFMAIPCFGDMEMHGLLLDASIWGEVLEASEIEKDKFKEQLDHYAANLGFPLDLWGNPVANYNSTDSNSAVLRMLRGMNVKVSDWDRAMGREVERLIDKTDDKTLKKAKNVPIVKIIKGYRSQMKRITTYGQNVIDAVHPVTGRIHCDFAQLGTATGRPASGYSPINMLNIPRDRKMRSAFKARDGYLIETHDYSGCELRIWADLSGDPGLCVPLINGEDLHCVVATKLYKKNVSKTENSELRTPAKTLNFGICYGMSYTSLYEKLNGDGFPISVQGAKELYDNYTKTFPIAMRFIKDHGYLATRQLYLQNTGGRIRHWRSFDDADPEVKKKMGAVRREGGNFMIQSVNADLTKYAMALIRDHIKRNKVRSQMVLQVYDEIVTETHKDDSEQFFEDKKRIMIQAAERYVKKVPIEVEGHVKTHWTK
jgi:DNA polymerase I